MIHDNFYTGYTTGHLTSLVDELTGEIKFDKTLEYNKDIFLPSPNYDEPVDILPGADKISDIDNLQYFFDKFLKTVERDKPDVRAAKHLKTIIDSIIIKDSAVFRNFNVLDGNFKQKFIIPIGKLDEEKTKSFITKLKEKNI
jgi:hypothetical protein